MWIFKKTPTQQLPQNSSQEGNFGQGERGRLDNYFVEYIKIIFAMDLSLFLYSNSCLLHSLPEQVGGKHGKAAAKGDKSEEK